MSNTPLQRRVVVEARDVILPGVIIMSINLLILVCWQVVVPLVFVRVVDEETVDNFGRQTDSHGSMHYQRRKPDQLYRIFACTCYGNYVSPCDCKRTGVSNETRHYRIQEESAH